MADLDGGWIAGTLRIDPQRLSLTAHLYITICKAMLNLPANECTRLGVLASDICHAVEFKYSGSQDGNVSYIVATPKSEENKRYVRGQLKAWLQGRGT
jgi:hypothetical protein